MGFIIYLLNVLSQQCIRDSVKFAASSSVLAAAVKFTNDNLKWDYLNEIMPNHHAFGLFASTVSFLLVFRTASALNRYASGASAAYHMTGAWFDAASSLFAFSRSATVPFDKVQEFRHMIVRLFSMLSMLCLEELENCADKHKSFASRFIVIDAAGLDPEIVQTVKNSKCKPEVVLQMIQCLIVDNVENGVLAVPAPILTRAFQDLGNGMLKFHETLHISRVSVPFPLQAVTQCLLFVYTLFTPFTVAMWTQGPIGAAWVTFVQISVFFTLNQLACEIEHPFSDRFKEVRIWEIHHQMNLRLASLNSLPASFLSQSSRSSESSAINRPSVWKPLTTPRHSFHPMQISAASTSFNPLSTGRNEHFRRRSQAEALRRQEIQFQELASVIGASDQWSASPSVNEAPLPFSRDIEFGVLSIPPGSRHFDCDHDQDCAFLDTSMLPRTLDCPCSPTLDDGTDLDPPTGPTVRLAMIPCDDPSHSSSHEEPSLAGKDE